MVKLGSCTRSSMDRASVCGTDDNGSIPFGCTKSHGRVA